MKRIHYKILLAVSITILLSFLCLQKKSNAKIGSPAGTMQGELDAGKDKSPPQNENNEITEYESKIPILDGDFTEKGDIDGSQASRIIRSMEVFAKIEEEYTRIRRAYIIPYGKYYRDRQNEFTHKLRIADIVLHQIIYLFMEIAQRGNKRDLLPLFQDIVYYENGEIHLPLAGGIGALLRYAESPELTDEDRGHIRQIIHVMHESAKTNVPMSSLVAPEDILKEWQEWEDRDENSPKRVRLLKEEVAHILSDNLRYIKVTNELAKAGTEVSILQTKYKQEYGHLFEGVDPLDAETLRRLFKHRDQVLDAQGYNKYVQDLQRLEQERVDMENEVAERIKAGKPK